ncbi:NAD(P)H dehydrogenase (quinone) [Tistlia consotensis]|uniref:NAD(P)H dehydrogenase (Quinone) n=1 Tax=Tistlia consotensis USBA 355 TaxID=560819 RepID=A0A1Y6BK06_9PROT|nr:NAD(P)H-dependent oxidoreductase [Tistlia consotensis]SMF14782.1 NAD(P)H dehydrogenase (quinone) [Tistlia consotensis USBA 355]SNR49240.1 NAD(P)H dehydrogenase (quinone) [Tistlia consotensis]
MRVHLVHAHPEADSFVAAMRDRAVAAFRARGDEVGVSDLYAMGFDPLLKAADFGERRDPGHLVYALEQRHGWETRTLAPDILAEVDKVLAADVLGFTFPVFWFGVPAILKGWIERVFLSGPFYGGRRIYGRGGLAGKRAFAAFSLGGRPGMFGPGSIHGELEQGMLRHFFQGTLGYVGLSVHRPFAAYHVPYLDAAAREALLDGLEDYLRTLDDQPTFRLPDLADFDERLEPRRR